MNELRNGYPSKEHKNNKLFSIELILATTWLNHGDSNVRDKNTPSTRKIVHRTPCFLLFYLSAQFSVFSLLHSCSSGVSRIPGRQSPRSGYSQRRGRV